MTVAYRIEAEGKVLYKNYQGNINISDIKSGWLHAINNNFITPEMIGFILDCREATLKLSIDDINILAKFFREQLDVFQDKKFAYITDVPNQVVIPILIQKHDFNYESRPFFTPEAAMEWLT